MCDNKEISNEVPGSLNEGSSSSSSSNITTLYVDCLEELFEWLSHKDLLALRQTCKRMKQTVDYYIRTNYPAVGKMEINDNNVKQIKKFHHRGSNPIELIEEVKISTRKFDLDEFKGLFNNVERIKLVNVKIEGEFYDFLKFCDKLKFLQINMHASDGIVIGNGNEWLLRQYPQLEHVGFKDGRETKQTIDELKTFFELNPNIHSLTTDYSFLGSHGIFLAQSRIKFDHLHVHVAGMLFNIDLLKELYRLGFYQRISLYGILEGDAVASLASIPGLTKVSTSCSYFKFPAMPDLKEVSFTHGVYLLQPILKNVNNIEELYVDCCCFDNIVPLIRYFPKLKVIRFHDNDEGDEGDAYDRFEATWGQYFNGNIVKLFALNKQREKLNSACKLTIYVRQILFLKYKWAKTKTNYRLIELKRVQAHDEYMPQCD
ncbi:uncharacterized protein LOC129574980 [Sitodiplosis mosellana]|uniref:uncharacterized protein LOC129574980 n=1 Tax=Sitodiplosis mosellana TaxID=263140 RepID=UPI0024447F37|nr:uncharacterized protein LOC129574980 [Sitodiplosis mosellana]